MGGGAGWGGSVGGGGVGTGVGVGVTVGRHGTPGTGGHAWAKLCPVKQRLSININPKTRNFIFSPSEWVIIY